MSENSKSELRELRKENALLRQAMAQTQRIQVQAQNAIRSLKSAQGNLRKALKIAEDATAARGLFLANMSHELRTPLNGIIGMTDLLLDGELNQEQADYAATVKISGEALAVLINDILDFSKIEAGKLSVESIPFDLRAEVDAMADILSRPAQSKGLELIVLVKAEVPHLVVGDPLRVRQIVLNLANNAIKFTQKGEVVIMVEREPGIDSPWIRFSVRDTGAGIAPDRIDAIFDAFTQENDSTSRNYGGTGLGLTICTNLTKLMGGQLHVESTLGEGSEFWFRIPLARAVETLESENEPKVKDFEEVEHALHELAIKRPSILVIDDNQTNLDVLAYRLKQKSFRPVCTRNPLLAPELLAAKVDDYAAVLLDYHMPEMDGLTLAKRLREVASSRSNLPIMLLTSVTDLDMNDVRESGVSAYMPKPVKESRLWRGLIMALKGSELSGKVRSPLLTPGLLEKADTQGKRFLVVDDNPVNLKVAVKMLEKAGVRADVAVNGQEALDAISRTEYAAVLMDCQMPVLDGFEATRELRRLEEEEGKGRHVPIIAMTASAMKEDQELCVEAGMDAYLSKPFRPSTLFEMVARFTQKTPQRRLTK